MDKKEFLVEIAELVDNLTPEQRAILLAFGSGILAGQEARKGG